MGQAPITLYQGEKAFTTLTRLEKSPSVDYLYRTVMGQNGALSWNNNLSFCGVYDRQNRALYLTGDSLNCLMEGQYSFTAKLIPSMVKEICGRIDQCVEDMIANDRDNLPVQELTGYQELHNLQYYQEYGAKEAAIQHFFKGMEPDMRFHSSYKLDGLPENAFMAYLQDPESFIQTEAEQYIKSNQERFLLDFLKNDALLAGYQALIQDTDNPIHRMRAITEAVQASGAKTVSVTVLKGGQELTFKAAAASLTGHKNYYSTYNIPAQDRREFERLFGRHADYSAEDIIKIVYSRSTIYETSPVQNEDMGPTMQMGGM